MLLEVRHIASVFKFDLTRQRPRLLWDSKSQKPLRFKVNSSQPKNPGGSLWLCSKCFTAASMHDLLYRTPTSYYGTRYAVPLCTVETQRKSPVWILCLFRIVRPFFCRKGITCESHAISSARRWVWGFMGSFCSLRLISRETLGDDYPERMLALEGNFVACRSIANLASGSTHLTLY